MSLMTATNDRSWWNMIRSGSTISMEAWDLKYKPNSDWNHAWGSAPANIIPGYMWGIRPVSVITSYSIHYTKLYEVPTGRMRFLEQLLSRTTPLLSQVALKKPVIHCPETTTIRTVLSLIPE